MSKVTVRDIVRKHERMEEKFNALKQKALDIENKKVQGNFSEAWEECQEYGKKLVQFAFLQLDINDDDITID